MKMTFDQISGESVRTAMSAFWQEHLAVDRSGEGWAVSLPLMYPDGLQVGLYIEPFSNAQAMITDRGRTLTFLEEQGVGVDGRARQNQALFEEKRKLFQLDQDGFELRKLIPLPLSGLDVQLFAESLISIAHLVYRREDRGLRQDVVRQSLRRVFNACHLQPKENVSLPGRVGKPIQVDFYFDAKKPMAMKSVDIHDRVKEYMEQWAWRWTDLHTQSPHILRAMIYNPDEQDWDETSLAIGREVCDLFCPYHDTDEIQRQLKKLKAA